VASIRRWGGNLHSSQQPVVLATVLGWGEEELNGGKRNAN